jgi:gamma-glutamyl hydrolase
MPSELQLSVQTENITMNNHHDGVTPESFQIDKNLADLFNVLAVNVDRQGKPFVSVMEAKKWPVYGIQFHPEKANFEWTDREVGHLR